MKRYFDFTVRYVVTKNRVLGIAYIGLLLVFALLISSCAPINYDFIGTWNRQLETFTYVNHDQRIKLTFPNDKWRVYTKPGDYLKEIWKNPWKNDSSYHVLWAFVPDWSRNELMMNFLIQPVKGHRLRFASDISLEEYTGLMKDGMMGPNVVDIDFEVIQRNNRRIGVITDLWKDGNRWLSIFFKEKGRFSMMQFNCTEGLFESNKNQFWAIVDSYEYLD